MLNLKGTKYPLELTQLLKVSLFLWYVRNHIDMVTVKTT